MTERNQFTSLFDPDAFRAHGHALIEQLADYLGKAQAGADMPVLPWRVPAAAAAAWASLDLPGGERDTMQSLVGRVLAESHHLLHPHYVGHQVPPPLPLAALCDLLTSFLNNSSAVYEMSPVGTPMELEVVRWFLAQIGWAPEQSSGVLTSGGSLGNLTALLAARQRWFEKHGPDAPLALLVSDTTHYSLARAAKVMGLREDAVVIVPTDENYRLRSRALQACYEGLRVRPFAVVASAGSTAVGACDPLEEIAEFCRCKNVWLHVDGAHGASALLGKKFRSQMSGIDQADSVVWDAHKMMLMPALVTAVLVKGRRSLWEALAHQASYLFRTGVDAGESYDLAQRSVECTKPNLALKVYFTIRLLSAQTIGAYVDSTFDLARKFADLICARADFELAIAPDCNIVCFRYAPKGCDPNRLQEQMREQIIASGKFYLCQTELRGRTYLRTTLISPFTELDHLKSLLDEVERCGSSILRQLHP